MLYPLNIRSDDFKDKIIECKYAEDFSINKLINLISETIKNNPERKDNARLKAKRRIYRIISNIFLPILVIGVISLYVMITNNKMVVNPWFTLFITIPLILWIVFDIKSNRIK